MSMVLSGSPFMLYSLGAVAVSVSSWIVFAKKQAAVKRGMREFARAQGFELLGKELPDGFIFRGTSMHEPDIANVMKGAVQGTETVLFTASFSVKDGNTIRVRTQTVVAFPNVNGLGSRQIPPTGDPNFFLEV